MNGLRIGTMTADGTSLDLSFSQENLKRYKRHFPEGLDELTAVLKAHLYVESMLRDFLSRSMPQPSHLEGARFSFTQVSLLARSLSPSALSSLTKPWTLIAKLNTLRNAMAHELDPDEAKIEGYKASIMSTISSDKDATRRSFAPALGYLCGFLSCHLQVALMFKDPAFIAKSPTERQALIASLRRDSES